MSRIHEALKKAQEERAEQSRADGGQFPIETATATIATTLEPPVAASELTKPVSGPDATGAVPSFLSNCRQNVWTPNPALLFQGGDNHHAGKEVFRTLRTRLYQIRGVQPLRTVLITSALPGEGKTFITSNLAQSIVRQRERRVLLIDGDLRLSRLHEALGAPNEPGLSDYLLGEADEATVLQRGADDNLFLIAGGRSISNPTELLANGKFEQLLSKLSPVFDWILIDSPPAIPVSDSTILARHCDGILMVVRSGVTPFDLAQKACQEFSEKILVGAVLNRADYTQSYGRYDYGGYLGETLKTKGSN
jgi:protein-tyrosine kinase